ncbi:hypothetical protein GCM10011360_28980 [Primorskyibacter flagellatus]|uniref:Uncharacterized protein n=1 Tax=Primorskyibacter flagellatus TaxID=1387277 RepID=A0A917EGA9_9RHOB|nr:hypothetical protein [Primorskyibacter flagellatus]GGE39521.1 hypothetical protein GCM10011360_28980 [Primorskyibacter flagellatus]
MPEHDEFDIFMKMLQIIEKKQDSYFGNISEEQQAKALQVIHKIEGNVYFQSAEQQEVVVGDQYKGGQVGAMGPNASATGNTFQQIWQENEGSLDLTSLASELETLRKALRSEATELEHDVAIGEIAAAQAAAASGDGPKALEHLRNAGNWALDIASKIGTGVATAAIKSGLGI